MNKNIMFYFKKYNYIKISLLSLFCLLSGIFLFYFISQPIPIDKSMQTFSFNSFDEIKLDSNEIYDIDLKFLLKEIINFYEKNYYDLQQEGFGSKHPIKIEITSIRRTHFLRDIIVISKIEYFDGKMFGFVHILRFKFKYYKDELKLIKTELMNEIIS